MQIKEKGESMFKKVHMKITDELVEISLQVNQYRLEHLEQYQFFLASKRNLLTGQITSVTEKKLVIQYQKNKYIESLSQMIKETNLFERLQIAQKINRLTDFINSPIQPWLHLDNLFFFGEEVVFAHRGFIQEIVPYTLDERGFLQQYRLLVLSIIYPERNIESLTVTNDKIKDTLFKLLHCAKSVEEIHQIIGKQLTKQKKIRAHKLQLVNKRNYWLIKWALCLFSLFTMGLSLVMENYAFHRFPQQERISRAKTQYISSNYASVLEILEKDLPENLSYDVQYVAAVSAIQLDNLTASQKKMVLKKLTQEPSENLLLYWIYIGKENFKKSLDIAQKLGDHQYILHTYTKLYVTLKANNKIGDKKNQKLIKKYADKIDHYTKKLGEKKSGNNTK